MADFTYQKAYPLEGDNTEYRIISSDYVSNKKFDGNEILKIDPKGLGV